MLETLLKATVQRHLLDDTQLQTVPLISILLYFVYLRFIFSFIYLFIYLCTVAFCQPNFKY